MRKYELLLEDGSYNRMWFEFDDLYVLSKFMEDAMKHASKPSKATISIIPETSEEVKADDDH